MIGLHPEGKVLKTLPNHPLTTLRKIPVVEVGIMPKPTVGLEPTTYGLQNRCSIQLSYTGVKGSGILVYLSSANHPRE
jgi:hypothetical protein